ncbi:hypothetical protein [Sphingobium sp. R-21]|uniref:hypothetical protein n=1 Tax=Sphingobium sp. R-21 TaxID=3404056 RepID=UPI003CF2FA1D
MSASESSNPSLLLRQARRQADAERRWLALGAARERSRSAAAISRDRKRQLTSAIDSWENEGGTAIGVAMSLRPKPLRFTKIQWCADLFRDDTTTRAAIFNGLLMVIAGTVAIILLNN